ncbi:MAG TPA: LamG domain-containing protein [Polyangiaceae bacterium]|nr:LamG domain-containing protein [Polyangiaceae bacterium]
MTRRGATWLAATASACALAWGWGLGGCDSHPLDVLGPSPLSYLLMAHYTFDEDGGATVHDHSGNGHDGVLSGGAFVPDGRFGGALRLGGNLDGGVGDYVVVDPFPDAPRSFSVSAWVRWNGQPDDFETVLSKEAVFDGGWQLNLETDAGAGAGAAIGSHFAFWDPQAGDGGAYVLVRAPVTRGAWTHLVAVLDGDVHTLSIYVGGQLAQRIPADHPISPGTSALWIGRWAGARRFLAGDLDDVALYGRALSSTEVLELEQHPPPDPM